MKYLNMILATVLVGIVTVQAAQDTVLTQRVVRDPRKLETWLEANATDAETRIAAIEGGTATVTLAPNKMLVGNDASNQTAMAVTGDVTITQDGTNLTTAIAAGVIVDADVNANAAIAYSKLANGTALSVSGVTGNANAANASIVAATDHHVLRRSGTAVGFGLLVDANVDAAAAIAGTKLSSAVQTSLGKADAAAPAVAVAGAPAVVGSVATLTNTVTVTAKDVAGATLAQARLVRVWVAETAYGAPSTNNIESLTLSGGTAIQTVTAGADYIYLTAATGVASAEVVGTGAGTNYVMVADGGYVTSAAVTFTE
jgi:hypothetical protein